MIERIEREILGYSIFFKKVEDAKKFYEKAHEVFEAILDEEEKEVTLICSNPVKKEDFCYVFKKDGKKLPVEPLKIMFVETLFVRE